MDKETLSEKSGEGKKLAGRIGLSLFAQVVSLLVSFLLGIIVPRFIDEYQYAYWQLYILYYSYTAVLHFGILDGIVLRYSQYDYENLDKRRMRSQLYFIFVVDSLLGLIGAGVAFFFLEGVSRTVVLLLSLGVFVCNCVVYNNYIFQITNRIKYYALIIIIQRSAYALAVVVLLVLGVNNFVYYCLADLLGQVAGILVGFFINRDLYLGRGLPLKETLAEAKRNSSAGIFLMLSSFSSMLIVGVTKIVIQNGWGELTFGKVSFSVSLTNLCLSFVTAISIVLFPALKRMKAEELPGLYQKLIRSISPVMVTALIFYFPLSKFIEAWLPKYAESILYVGLLLPMILFSAKMSLVNNNYLMAYRMEKTLLAINFSCVALTTVGTILITLYFRELNAVLLFTVGVMILRTLLSDLVVMRKIRRFEFRFFLSETVMAVIFILATLLLPWGQGFLLYAAALLLYFVIHLRSFIPLIKSILHRA